MIAPFKPETISLFKLRTNFWNKEVKIWLYYENMVE